ncbi:MAG: TAXI family TRAP transporter solute-binding subunit [Betaproteobacteria bacterium]|nr:MAG: TAXI family TRAP transporter solute-binding subunit [Betaproteobacteria bacterium]
MNVFARTFVALSAIAVALCAVAQNQVTLSISTGPTTGVYYPLGGGIANLLSKYVPGYAANAETTAGSVANLQLMGQKKSDLALSMADAAWDGFKGQGRFASGAVPVRALMVAYPNSMHVVTIEGTGINKFADLKGKRVSTGAPNSATEVMAARVLEAMGLDFEKDIKRERLDPGKSSDAIKDRKLDAYFWVGGIPTSAVTDLGATPGTKLKLIDHADAVDAMNKKYGPLYTRDTIPAKSYPGQEQAVQVATVWNLIVAHADMPNDVAYNIVKTIFDKRDELIQVHKEAQNFDLKNQSNSAASIPYHPGAIKYFAERGITLK